MLMLIVNNLLITYVGRSNLNTSHVNVNPTQKMNDMVNTRVFKYISC